MIPTKSQWKNWSLPSKYSGFGVLIGLISLFLGGYALVPSEIPTDKLSIVKGEYILTNLGTHEINYGIVFKSKPSLSFHGGKIGGIENPETFEILEQRKGGFTFRVGGALTVGTTIIWQVSGER